MPANSDTLSENRHAFVGYTIARIRELLRYLPQAKARLFESIPFFLHVNSPDFPGYVESEEIFYGIDRFEQSGFFKLARRTFDRDDDVMKNLCPASPVIQGLYLMGSAGTLTQSRKSDFDYWVIIDEKELGVYRKNLLELKLRHIEAWCKDVHRQEVTFFIMDAEKLRHNEFSTVDGESSGSAQRTLLKDEFYRTFIMIAGKIPLWAVMSPGQTGADVDAHGNEYLDTGDLTAIDAEECLGAVLWQVYKARKDPVKALIKSSLAAAYAFNADDPEALISFMVRQSFSKTRIDDYLYDPYVMVFDTIQTFYHDMDNMEGLNLIRQCILLRLMGYPGIEVPDPQSPKGRLLRRFAEAWNMGRSMLDHLASAGSWNEPDKIAFEDKIFDKLSFLYELLLRSMEDENPTLSMKKDDLDILKNRTAAFLQKKPGKLPKCSTYLRHKTPDLDLMIHPQPERNDAWNVSLAGKTPPLFSGPEYLKTLGWIFANQLHLSRFITSPPHFQEIRGFLSPLFPRPDHVFTSQPQWERVVLLFKKQQNIPEISSVDYLIFNSWGEAFFDSIELSSIESMEQKCYKCAEIIFNFQAKNQDVLLRHFICRTGDVQRLSIENKIVQCLDLMELNPPEPRNIQPMEDRTENVKKLRKNKPFLDLI